MSALIPATQEVATSSTINSTSQANGTAQDEVPQGLKPRPEAAIFGAAEAAPLQDRNYEIASKDGAPAILVVQGSFDSPAQQQGGLAQDDKVKGKPGGLAQDDRDSAGATASKSRKNRSNRAPKGSTEAPKEPSTEREAGAAQAGPSPQKEKEAAPDLQLFTTAGHKLVLPSRDKPVSVEQLVKVGEALDATIAADSRWWPGESARRAAIEYQLWIRGKNKRVSPVYLNPAQREVDRKAGKRNIVLKARQVGITTYVAARFFLSTMLQPGTLSVQVAHDQQSAEEIFRIVHRFLENLPEAWRRSALRTSRANVRQIIFPKLDSEYRVESAADRCAGRGLTIQNLHCSEVARWPHDVAETLAALRAAVPPDGEIFLESTPSGAGGTFYEEWQSAPETGYVQHFLPWWWEENYRREVEIVNFTDEELELMAKHKLDAAQIAFRREMRSQFRNRFLEEYAEDAETCFLTSGNCMFDCEVLAKELKKPEVIVDEKENGKLLYFLQPQPGRDYIIGVDPSSGHPDGDYGCIQVIDAESGMQCAEWHDRFRPEEAAHNAVTLAKDYHMALIAVERNGVGEA